MILFTVGMMVAFTACQQAKKVEQVVEEVVEEAIVEEEAPALPEIKPADALKAFQTFAKEYAEAYNNITKNPVKYTQLAGQYKQKIADVEKAKEQFTPAQLKSYEKAMQMIRDVNSGGSKK